jgi:hypothetical protein
MTKNETTSEVADTKVNLDFVEYTAVEIRLLHLRGGYL